MSDAKAIHEIAAVSDVDATHTILHYLYLPSAEEASKVAEKLNLRGFRTEERVGGDGVNWLVLARHEVVPSEELMAVIRISMEELVAGFENGEYDGWEADMR